MKYTAVLASSLDMDDPATDCIDLVFYAGSSDLAFAKADWIADQIDYIALQVHEGGE